MGDVVKCVFGPVSALCGEPETENPELFMQVYQGLLAEHPDEILSLATTKVLSKHKYKKWPNPALFVEAIAEVKREQAEEAAKNSARHVVEKTAGEWRETPLEVKVGLYMNVEGQRLKSGMRTIDASKWSPEFCAIPLVQMAEHEGWGRDLRYHVRAQLMRKAYLGIQFARDRSIYMPDNRWVKHSRYRAQKVREADEWREQIKSSKSYSFGRMG